MDATPSTPVRGVLRARPTLAAQVIGVLAGLTLLALASILLLSYRSARAGELAQLQARLAWEADALAESTALPVWNFDQPQLMRILRAEARQESIVAVEVSFGRTLPRTLGYRRLPHGDLLEVQRTGPERIHPLEDEFLVERSIRIDDDALGTLRLLGTARPLLASLHRDLRDQAIQILAVGLLLGGALYLLLWKVVVRPVQALQAYADGGVWEVRGRPASLGRPLALELEKLRLALTFALETEHQRLEALAESESRARSLIDLAPEAILLLDPVDWIIQDLNPAAEALLGGTRASLLGQDFLQCAASPDAGRLHEALQRAREGAASDLHLRLKAPGGRLRTCEARLVLHPARNAPSLRLSLIDVSDRVEAERRTAESLSRLSRFEAALDASAIVALTDPEGRITAVNARFCQISGYTEAELIGQDIRILRSGFHSKAFFEDLWTTIRSGRVWRGEIRNRSKGGEGYWVDTTIIPLLSPEGGIEAYMAIRFDITDRKRGEEQLRKLSRIVEQSQAQILVADVQGHIEYANPSYLEASGQDLPALQASNLWLLELKGLTPASETRLWEAIAAGERWSDEVAWVDDDGTPRTASLQLSLLQDDAGMPTHLILLKQDLTRQRRMEAEHQAMEAQLQQAQKLEAIGQLAGGIAHDMNNMLTAVMGHVELLRLQVPEDPKVQRHLAGIEATAQRSRDIVANILAFSRRQAATPVPIDLNAHLAATRIAIAPLISEDILITFDEGPDLRRLVADSAQVDQVLMNLLVNARDAMPQGGRLLIETRNAEVDATFCEQHPGAQPGAFVRLRIRDTGVGMDELTRARVFEPFFTTKPVGKGTGLGLSTVIGIIKQHQGFLTLESHPGEGTTFDVYFPALPEGQDEAGPAPVAEPVPPAPASLSLLVVEDDPLLRQVVLSLLRKLNYQARAAEDPEEALDLARDPSIPVDLLLCDVIMPGMNGKDLAEAFLKVRPGTPVLFMSGYSADILGPHGVLEGSVHLIQKPFTMESLSAKIARMLSRDAGR